MKSDLLRFNNKQKYCIFDYETCNLNLGSFDNKPWQLAFIIAEGKKVLEKHKYHLAWKDLNVSEDAAKITGFNKSTHNKLAKDPRDVLAHFEEYLYNEDYILVGHNILGFDVYIHNIHRALLGEPTDYSYIERAIDTACVAKAVKKGIKFLKNESRISWQYKLNNLVERGLKVNLQQCCRDYSIDFDPTKLHDALYDIEKNFEVFTKILWDVEL